MLYVSGRLTVRQSQRAFEAPSNEGPLRHIRPLARAVQVSMALFDSKPQW